VVRLKLKPAEKEPNRQSNDIPTATSHSNVEETTIEQGFS
jgi:hypothetical protein